jgi:hypothetical protein
LTLRIELSIIPFGDEDEKRVIETINVSNLGPADRPDLFQYVVEHNDYKNYDNDTLRVLHNRRQGALKLAQIALQELNGAHI